MTKLLTIASMMLTLPVLAESYESFIATHSLTGAAAEPNADPDSDGICNLLEFALAGLDPAKADTDPRWPEMNASASQRWLAYTPRANTSGVRYIVQGSTDVLQTWYPQWLPPETGFMRLRVEHSVTFGQWADAIDEMLTDPAKSQDIFTVKDHASAIYVRNPECWGYAINLTAISPWNSTLGSQMAGTLVSPRHVIFANHYHPGAGARIRFVSADSQMFDRTVVSVTHAKLDLAVGVLDSDLPPSIAFARVLPSNWQAALPQFNGYRVAGVSTNQFGRLTVRDVASVDEGGIAAVGAEQPSSSLRAARFELAVAGDSGSPFCLWVNGHLVLLCCWTNGGAGGGTSVSGCTQEINAIMAATGGPSLTAISLP